MALPSNVCEAMVQCCGTCFFYKHELAHFFAQTGVSQDLIYKYRQQSKYEWARRTISDLSHTVDGHNVLLKMFHLLSEMTPSNNIVSPNDCRLALKALKDLWPDLNVEHAESVGVANERRREPSREILAERLSKLRADFNELSTRANRQAAGYALEDLLHALLDLFKIEHRASYRAEGEQTDGHMKFDGFDYLIEARWQRHPPTTAEIDGFQGKVRRKLHGTRGLFIAVQGVRPEVIDKFNNSNCSVIIVDGDDLRLVLDGAVDLADALKFKIKRAAQTGKAFISLREFHQ